MSLHVVTSHHSLSHNLRTILRTRLCPESFLHSGLPGDGCFSNRRPVVANVLRSGKNMELAQFSEVVSCQLNSFYGVLIRPSTNILFVNLQEFTNSL